MINTAHDLKLANGETVKVESSFGKLYILRAKNKAVYERYNKAVNASKADLFNVVDTLYGAYRCANLEDENYLTYEEFMNLLPADMEYCYTVYKELVSPGKK